MIWYWYQITSVIPLLPCSQRAFTQKSL